MDVDQQDQAESGHPVSEAAGGNGSTEEAATAAEWEDRWRRTAADLDNLRKRYGRELDRARAGERAAVASAWLPIIDNIELALVHADADPAANDPMLEGIRAVRDQAVAVLSRLGYVRHDADDMGRLFDPARHEVVSVVEDSDVEPGTVVRVLRPGYGDGDHQLRPAAVAVARARD
jgi:molecular chaperone GrpE